MRKPSWVLAASHEVAERTCTCTYFCARRFFVALSNTLQADWFSFCPSVPQGDQLAACHRLRRGTETLWIPDFNAVGWRFPDLNTRFLSIFLHMPLLTQRVYISLVPTSSDDPWAIMAWCLTSLNNLVPSGTMMVSFSGSLPILRLQWPSTEWQTGPAQKSGENGKENGTEMAEKWPPKWENGPKNGIWAIFLYFFHFGGHFSAISGRGPFSIFFPISPDFFAPDRFPILQMVTADAIPITFIDSEGTTGMAKTRGSGVSPANLCREDDILPAGSLLSGLEETKKSGVAPANQTKESAKTKSS